MDTLKKELVVVRDFDDGEYASLFEGKGCRFVKYAYGDASMNGEDHWIDYSRIGAPFVRTSDVMKNLEGYAVPMDAICVTIGEDAIVVITAEFLYDGGFQAMVTLPAPYALSDVLLILPAEQPALGFPIHPMVRDGFLQLVCLENLR